MRHSEFHRTHRVGWLRAAVLGANDGIVSTASLIVGVAAAASDKGGVLVAGIAGLVAGAMSMAAGEYVSVSSQADTEGARSPLAGRTGNLRHPQRTPGAGGPGVGGPGVGGHLRCGGRHAPAARGVGADRVASLGRVGGLTVLPGSPRRTGGTRRRIPVFKSVLRVTFWGALAMALTAGVGALFGATV